VKRRKFVTLLASGAAAWPLASRAQQPKSAAKTWRIGFLQPPGRQETLLELRSGLRDLGYTEGQNIVLESRVVQDANHDALIAELLRLKIDVLVTFTTPLALISDPGDGDVARAIRAVQRKHLDPPELDKRSEPHRRMARAR
jgi:hypothetical protein